MELKGQPGLILALAGLAFIGPTPASSSTPLLPNLVALPASELRIDVLPDGTRELRFSTTSANLGAGNFEIIAGQISGSSQQVDQRVFNSDGTWIDSFAGFMTYHAQHGHMHVDDYAYMDLESDDAPGASLRSGAKQTFCIIDTDRIDHKLPGASKRPQYTSCGTFQGLAVGWGDTYRYYLFGQSIDITGLSDGVYRLVIEIDPKNHFLETDDGDNTSSVTISIVGTTVEIVGSGGNGGGNGNSNGRGNGRNR